MIPGKPLYYATAMEQGGAAIGLLVESHMGRPTKIEGNPEHPSSLGSTDHFAQASILNLWDPDRSQTVRYVGETSTWGAFVAALQATVKPLGARGGAGLRILTETTTSPTFKRQMQVLLQTYPAAVWHTWEPVSASGAREGARAALGQPLNTVYRFDQADLIVSLDADFLSCGPGAVRYARDFADRRRVRQSKVDMNRLYVVESMPTPTGTMADHRLAIPSGEVEEIARAIAASLGLGGAASGRHAEWAASVARDLQAHAGRSVVLAGEAQPAAVHAIAHAINAALGNVGTTLVYTEPIEANPVDQTESMRAPSRSSSRSSSRSTTAIRRWKSYPP
ncbi:MAG: hypothetical protein LC732_11395 [Acidobacteria bacterium]|nr:hypothetical protein [Acidobacteriota bacterium]